MADSLFQRFQHDVPEDFEGDYFDFDVFAGAGQVDGFELFEQVGGIAFCPDRMEVGFGHLHHHFDHAVAAEGVVMTEVAVGVLFKGIDTVDDGVVVFFE